MMGRTQKTSTWRGNAEFRVGAQTRGERRRGQQAGSQSAAETEIEIMIELLTEQPNRFVSVYIGSTTFLDSIASTFASIIIKVIVLSSITCSVYEYL